MSYPVGEWIQNPEGYPPGSWLYNGPILFPAGIDPDTTQTVVAVFGPAGGRMNFPPLQAGRPGQPPLLTKGGVTTLTPGSDATFDLIRTAPGGEGIASAYEVFVGIPEGQPAVSTPNTLITPKPTDLNGTPQAGYAIGYDAGAAKAKWTPLPFTAVFNVPAASIAATGSSGASIRTLTYITIPAQAGAYIPFILGADVVTTGTVNTQIDLVARLGGSPNTNSGSQIARGRGQIGAVTGTNPWATQIIPNFSSLLTGGYGQVAANTSATIYLNCERQDGTTDQYATGAASLTIGCLAVPA